MKRTPPLQNAISDSGDPFLTSFDLFQSCPNRRRVLTVRQQPRDAKFAVYCGRVGTARFGVESN